MTWKQPFDEKEAGEKNEGKESTRAKRLHVFCAKEDSLQHTKRRMALCLFLPFLKQILYLKLGAGGREEKRGGLPLSLTD